MDKATIIKGAVDTLMATFKSGEFPAQIALNVIRKHEGDTIPADGWSFANRVLASLQGAYDARGFNQWKQVNRAVKRGSKAIHIFAPSTRKITETDEEGNETAKIIVTGFRPIPVFRYEDTEGEPLPSFDYKPKKFPPFFDVAEKIGVTVEYRPMIANHYGRFCSGTKAIELNSQDAVVYYHELAHAVHNTFVDLKTCDKAKKEIVAEFAAVTLCELSGISGYQSQGYDYIKSYCKGDAKPEKVLRKIMCVLNDVEKIVTIVLDATENKIPSADERIA